MILTNTIVKHIPIPQGANFISVTVYNYKSVFCDETGVETVTIESRKTMVNAALVSELKPVVMKASVTQWTRMSRNEWRSLPSGEGGCFRDSGWARPNKTPFELTQSIEVLEVTKLHKDVQLDAHYITIDAA